MKGEQIGHESQLLVFYFEAHFDRSAPSALSLQHLGSYLAKDGVSNEQGGFSPLGAQTGPPRLPMARGAVPSPGDTKRHCLPPDDGPTEKSEISTFCEEHELATTYLGKAV